ncbi:hypothetical protein PIROE2DRAFT_21193 [Piromyces sp. E2]|nr:hypothetical protein PIROE2DRAFT_21193 [Piromyces sp. E2]|eukprot:OUM59670.1 hypothetical protein PIROE2DRAFT_21193 [Piromyces sp. E2]
MKKLRRDKIPKKIEHRWELNSFTDNATFCNHCNIIIVQGLICSICQRTCHLEHLKHVDALDCKCGCFISPELPKENNTENNTANQKWYQKGLLRRGSSWISKTSRKSTNTDIKLRDIDDNKSSNTENIVDIKENIVEIQEGSTSGSIKKDTSSLEKIVEDDVLTTENGTTSRTPLVNDKRVSRHKLIRGMSKKEEELYKEVMKRPQREESVIYPNEEVNKTENKNTGNRPVLLKGSSYYSMSMRESRLISEPSVLLDSEINDPYASILKNSETGNYNHQWVKYKTHSPYFCQVCSKRVSNGPLDFDYHCVWCQICVHKKCIEKYSLPCYLSIIPEVVMPPHYISLCNRKKKTRDEVVPKYTITQLEGSDLATKKPLICVINPKSGEGATSITREMYSLLNPVQICDITYDNPDEVILSFIKNFSNCRIIACGGDGTVSWMNSIFDKFLKEGLITREQVPPIGVIPLGTGNDLSRVLGWGGGYDGESAIKLFRKLTFDSEIIEMDRWKVEVIPDKSFLHKLKLKQGPKTIIMNNYFSIGSDANIAYAFHTTRKEHPSLFKSRVVNKIWYFSLGGVEYFKSLYNSAAGHIVGLFRRKSDSSSSESKKTLNASDTLYSLNPEHEDNYSMISDGTTNNNHNDDKISIASSTKSKSKSNQKGKNVPASNNNNQDNIDAVTVDTDALSINDKKSVQSSVKSVKTNNYSSFDDVIDLELDGKQIDVNNLSGIIVLNINSYGGGSKFFQKEGDGDSGILPLIKNAFNSHDYPDYSCNDHQLEVVGVHSALHAGISLAGVVTPEVLGVVKQSLKLTIRKKMAVQVDGEPWMQTPSVIEVTFNNKTKYLKRKGTNLY